MKASPNTNFFNTVGVFIKFFGALIGMFLCTLLFSSGFVSATSTLNDGLVANWTFDTCTATDDTANTNNGQIVGNPRCVNGVKSKALQFDGVYSPDYVIIPNSSDIAFTNNFTFSLWFNVASNISMDGWGQASNYGQQVLLAKSGDREGIQISLYRQPSDGLWYPSIFNGRCCTNAGRGLNAPAGFGATLGTWHLVTVTLGDGKIQLYVDGKFAAEDTTANFNINPATFYSNLQLSIGEWQYYYPFSGIMDDVRVYNRSLSALEAKALYEEVFPPPPPPITPTTAAPEITNICPPDTICASAGSNTTEIAGGTWYGGDNWKLVQNNAGDPVILSTGESIYTNTFLHTPGIGIAYDFTLTNRTEATYDGPVGINWDHNYNIFLKAQTDGSVNLYDGKLGVYSFPKNPDGTFSRNVQLKGTITKTPSGTYEMRFDSGLTYAFNAKLRISAIHDRNNNSLSFSYDDTDKLTKVTDTLGREYAYAYRQDKRLQSVTDFTGKKVLLNYLAADDVTGSKNDLHSASIKNTDGTEKSLSFSYTKVAGSEKLSHNLRSFTDAAEQIYVENTFDGNDRIITQKYGDGILHYEYALDPTNTFVQKNKVTNKRGIVTNYTFDAHGNTLSMTVTDGSTITSYLYSYDSKGRLSAETKPNGNSTAYQYDERGNVTEKRQKSDMNQPNNDTVDLVTKFAYDPLFNTISEVTDPNGVQTMVSLDAHGNITKILVPAVHLGFTTSDIIVTNEYDANGNLTKTTDPEGRIISYEYANGLPTKITKGTGTEITTTTLTYDANGNPLTITDGESNTKTFTYDAFNNLKSSLTAEGITKSFSFNANNKLSQGETFLAGSEKLTQTNQYNILDELTGTTAGSSPVDTRNTTILRDPNGNITEVTDARGTKTRLSYDALERVIEKRSITDPTKDQVTRYSYDANGNLVSIIDPRGNETRSKYNRFDRAIQITDALGTTTNSTRDKNGNITETTLTDKNGVVLSKSSTLYNEIGKPLSVTVMDPKSGTTITTKSEYDRSGNLISKTDPKGNITQYSYDSQNRIVQTVDSIGNTVTITYDKRGLIVNKTITSSNGTTLTTTYNSDKDGRIIRETNAEGKFKSYTYNTLGQITQMTDEALNKTDSAYDVFGNTLSQTQYLSGSALTTRYEYDKGNNLMSLTDAKGNKTSYEYDALGRKTKEILPDGAITLLAYDLNGNLISKTDPNGSTITNTYDTLGRLTKRTIARGAGVLGVSEENYTYDAMGRLIGATDSDGNALGFDYDSFNRLLAETENGKNVSYTYDSNSNPLSILYPSGKKVEKSYDALNRLLGVNLAGETVASYSYNSLFPENLSYSNGTQTTYSFDGLARLSTLTTTLIGNSGKSADGSNKSETLSYDPIGNILSDGMNSYVYDTLSRITGAGYPGVRGGGDSKEREEGRNSGNQILRSEAWTYDPVGSRVQSVETITKDQQKKEDKDNANKVQTTTYTTNPLNQYLTAGTTPLSYDKNGNVAGNGDLAFAYDYRNRLIEVKSIKNGESVVKYSYDVLGRRITKETKDTLIKYVFSGQDAIEESEYFKKGGDTNGKDQDSGKKEKGASKPPIVIVPQLQTTREYLYSNTLDDVLLMITTANSGKKSEVKKYFYYKNHLGSIIGLSDESGKMVEEYQYDAFGKPYVRKNRGDEWKRWKEFTDTKSGNTRLFTGREYDNETNLYYYRARFYDPSMGRFLSRDPIGMRDDVNLYSYVGNRVVGFVDPMGREKTLQKVVDIFNRYGDYFSSRLSSEKYTIYGLLGIHPDYNVDLNLIYGSVTVGGANIKVNEDIRSDAVWIDPINCNSGLSCGKKIVIGGKDIWLSDLGNLLYGFNAFKIGFSYEHARDQAMNITQLAADDGAKKEGAIANELADQPFYRAGYYNLAGKETVTANDILSLLSIVIKSDTKYSFRTGW